MVIPIVIDALGTIPKGWVKEVEDLEIWGQVETIQTTTLVRLTRILRRVLETCCHSSEKPSANAGVENSQKRKIMILSLLLGHYTIRMDIIRDYLVSNSTATKKIFFLLGWIVVYFLHLCYIHNVFFSICPPSFFRCFRTQESTQNFEPHPLFNLRGSLVLIPL